MKKLISFLSVVAIVIIGCIFASCIKEMKQDIQQVNQVVAKAEAPTKTFIGHTTFTTKDGKLHKDVPTYEVKSRVVSEYEQAEEILSYERYALPVLTHLESVLIERAFPQLDLAGTYINYYNNNDSAGVFYYRYRTNSNMMVLVGPAPLDRSPQPSIREELFVEPVAESRFPIVMRQAITQIPGAVPSRSNLYPMNDTLRLTN